MPHKRPPELLPSSVPISWTLCAELPSVYRFSPESRGTFPTLQCASETMPARFSGRHPEPDSAQYPHPLPPQNVSEKYTDWNALSPERPDREENTSGNHAWFFLKSKPSSHTGTPPWDRNPVQKLLIFHLPLLLAHGFCQKALRH